MLKRMLRLDKKRNRFSFPPFWIIVLQLPMWKAFLGDCLYDRLLVLMQLLLHATLPSDNKPGVPERLDNSQASMWKLELFVAEKIPNAVAGQVVLRVRLV